LKSTRTVFLKNKLQQDFGFFMVSSPAD